MASFSKVVRERFKEGNIGTGILKGHQAFEGTVSHQKCLLKTLRECAEPVMMSITPGCVQGIEVHD